MRILVAGASGVIGQRAVPLMLACGHQVTALGRSRDRLARLAQEGATATTVDLFDPVAIRNAMAGHDAVVNLATHIPGSFVRAFIPGAWAENDRIRKVGSSILADAAIELGVPRFVQESFALTYPDSGVNWVDETIAVQPTRYNRTVLDAEASAMRVTRAGACGVALRFALLYGPGDRFTREVFHYVARGWIPLLGRPDGYVSMVTQDDAASAVVAALKAPAGVYNVVDDEPLTRRELGDTIASIIGARPPKLPPAWLARFGGSIGETLARSLRLSNRKLRATGLWEPRYSSGLEGWRAASVAFEAFAGAADGARHFET